ncbi:hypothetical protein S7711_11505 [Stachybotrys chartarum IBT 7711]|uniref:Uncharacterized protein n=1 Tax=Stachybotrys chartarum (strain CBS 109288 / IBT 7711) TaxID=1280523 RepID=A0A084ALC7_STACB|nr:hypothetical protein S7711_11505 [Stachybotrys chartarum IBT 7711]
MEHHCYFLMPGSKGDGKFYDGEGFGEEQLERWPSVFTAGEMGGPDAGEAAATLRGEPPRKGAGSDLDRPRRGLRFSHVHAAERRLGQRRSHGLDADDDIVRDGALLQLRAETAPGRPQRRLVRERPVRAGDDVRRDAGGLRRDRVRRDPGAGGSGQDQEAVGGPPISRRADPPRGSALDGVRVGSPDGPAVGAGHDGAPAREALQGRGAGVAAAADRVRLAVQLRGGFGWEGEELRDVTAARDAGEAEGHARREPFLPIPNWKSMLRKRATDEEYTELLKMTLLSMTARELGLRRNDGCEVGRLMAAAAKHRWGPGRSVRLRSEPRDMPALEEEDRRLAREAAAADGGRGKYELPLRYDAAEKSKSVTTSFVDLVDEPEDPVLPERRTADGGLAADGEDKDTATAFTGGRGDNGGKHHAPRCDADEATTVLADLLDKPRNVLEGIFGPPPEARYIEKTGRWILRGQSGLAGW